VPLAIMHAALNKPSTTNVLKPQPNVAAAFGAFCAAYRQHSPDMSGRMDTVPLASTLAMVSHSPWSHFRWPSSVVQQQAKQHSNQL
jgi:hypothetical protein